jgi:hypothetical protein
LVPWLAGAWWLVACGVAVGAIALLNEQKQAIIHRAVTRGLDPSVPTMGLRRLSYRYRYHNGTV